MKRKEINFDSFWKLKNNHMSAFFTYWNTQCNKHDEKDWPSHLSEGEWEEQFDIFIENIYKASMEKNGFYKPY